MKDKLFTSTNSKKGVLLEIENDEVKISVWKKETPVSDTIDKETAFEINSFFMSEFSYDEDDTKGVEWWINYVKGFKAERENDDRLDEAYDPEVVGGFSINTTETKEN